MAVDQLRNAIMAAVRAPWTQRSGQGSAADLLSIDYARDNGTPVKYRNGAGTADIDALNVDSDDAILLGGQVVRPTSHTFAFPISTNASIVNQAIWIAPFACRITAIVEIHAVAGNDAAAVTGKLEKLTSGIAVGSGLSLHTAVSLKATANTEQACTLTTASPRGDGTSADLELAIGDRIGFVLTGTATNLSGLVFFITVTPGLKYEVAKFQMQANGDLVDQAFFVANRPCKVVGAYWVHGTLGTNGSAVNVQLVKDTSTNAPGAGTDLLTNSTNAGFDCKAAINVVQTGVLVATAASLRLAVGDRLSADFAGTLTALAGCVMVVLLEAMGTERQITYNLSKNANLVDQCFWRADRNYQVVAIREVHAVIGTDGSAVSLQVVIDKTTDAPGAGVDLLTNNTNAGFDLKATANTPQIATLADRGSTFLMQGDRLSVDYAGTLTAVAGVVVTVSLVPA